MRNDFFVGTNWSRHLLGLHCRCLASKMLSWFWFWWQATDHCWYSQNGWQPWLQKSRERWCIVLGYWHQIMICNFICLIVGSSLIFFRNKDMLCKLLVHHWSSHCSCNFLWCLFRNILHPDTSGEGDSAKQKKINHCDQQTWCLKHVGCCPATCDGRGRRF